MCVACVSSVFTMTETGIRVRVDKSLRDEFIEACRTQDKTASQVLRAYMRDYVARHKSIMQGELFPPSSKRD